MGRIEYVLTSSESQVCESGLCKCYGISCLENGKEIIRYPDVLPDKQKVKLLVEICNRLEVAPIHLPDILEDFLP